MDRNVGIEPIRHKNIDTLVADIYALIGQEGWRNESFAEEVAASIAARLKAQTKKVAPRLRLSQMGPRCPRALWHSIHTPELAETLPPWAQIKYTYGHFIEALAICLARRAGHEVTGEQDEVEVDGILGHRDCVIDGCIIDVKSSSSRGFSKFKDGSIAQSDDFGYLDQLDGYLLGSANDPLVRVKDRAYLLAIDKQLGHMVLYEHKIRPEQIRQRVAYSKAVVGSNTPPACECETRPDGKSGNITLGIKASYSAYKYCCFPNLRTFLYSDGPRYLTHVERTPDVPEVDFRGKIIYN